MTAERREARIKSLLKYASREPSCPDFLDMVVMELELQIKMR